MSILSRIATLLRPILFACLSFLSVEALSLSNPPADSDSDGVADTSDQCDNTPAGEAVDSNGCSSSQIDSDGDGRKDNVDVFPNNPNEWADLDGDGIGDNADTDRDGDGFSNTDEATAGSNPNDANSVPADLDNDGIPDFKDDDRDGDGVANASDAFPDDASEASDLDGDGVGDNADSDRDGDGISNDYEAQVGTDPNDASSRPTDLDGDGIPDALDNDIDGDGVDNVADAFPANPSEWSDLDNDGIGDNSDSDRDGDGISNDYETQAGTNLNDPANVPSDIDGDGIPDVLEEDRDGDGVANVDDAFPDDPNESADLDNDGIGDNADTDRDGDGISNDYEVQLGFDPNDASSSPADLDADGLPDSLDNDRDGDGVNNDEDVFPDNAAESSDLDGDGIGDNADTDRDGDGISNEYETQLGFDPDNAQSKPVDSDADGIPNELDSDRDGDGVENNSDAFPDDATETSDLDGDGIGDNADSDRDGDGISNAHEEQLGTDPNDAASKPSDIDTDGIPDALDDDKDGDGFPNETDAFPEDANESSDLDGDGVGDNADLDRDGDGISNQHETQLGTDANDPNDTPADLDGDSIPDALDNDRDGDGVNNDLDAFPNDPSETSDLDGDGVGDNIDLDRDGDGVNNLDDIFPDDPSEWADSDGDGIGDNADTAVGGSIDWSQENTIVGTGEREFVVTLQSNDTLNGKGSNDILMGGEDDDLYIIARGDGHDRIIDSSGQNTVKFDSSIAFSDVSSGFKRQGNDLVLEIGSNVDQSLRVQDFFAIANTIQGLEFENEGLFPSSQIYSAFGASAPTKVIAARTLILGNQDGNQLNGTNAGEVVVSGKGRDTLQALKGDDVLVGGEGHDTYAISLDGGNDFIVDTAGSNTIQFSPDISVSQFSTSRIGNDLIINIATTPSATVRVYGFFELTETITNMRFANGSYISDLQIYAAYNAPEPTESVTILDILSVEPNADYDGDGVINQDDKCPLTPAGESVDADGCHDSDGDGVSDLNDICPSTPVSEFTSVDVSGCSDSQRDTDKDGVTDNTDTCPNTIPGWEVDATGCADYQRDTDNDGVNDNNDVCPATPENESADSEGCSESQRDTDNDSVFDHIDQCPGTSAGSAVDANGCALDQRDTDQDGVNDGIDECPTTPAGESVDAVGCGAGERDTDNDGILDSIDTDDDNDGYLDVDDELPLDPAEHLDTDRDGIGNNADSDDDGDTYSDTQEAADGTDPLNWQDNKWSQKAVKSYIPQTGITTSFIDGDDGALRSGTPRVYERAAAGYVIDKQNNLYWQDSPENKDMAVSWVEARDYCDNLDQGNINIWRLPTILELFMLMDQEKNYVGEGLGSNSQPLIPDAFQFVAEANDGWSDAHYPTYWSSTRPTVGSVSNGRWTLKFYTTHNSTARQHLQGKALSDKVSGSSGQNSYCLNRFIAKAKLIRNNKLQLIGTSTKSRQRIVRIC
jgi:hypothetical protein